MDGIIPTRGCASEELQNQAHTTWQEEARVAGLDLSGFDPSATLPKRITWATSVGLGIGTVLARHSTKDLHSTAMQVLGCNRHAARHRIYSPPEFVCQDESRMATKPVLDGVERMELILKYKFANVLLVYDLKRLSRTANMAMRYVNDVIVDQGLRVISVAQGIDTADEKVWKDVLALYGTTSEMLQTTSDLVRINLQALFRNGFAIGFVPVGYFVNESSDAPARQ